MAFAVVYQWCVHHNRVRTIYSGVLDNEGTSHVGEQEMSVFGGGGTSAAGTPSARARASGIDPRARTPRAQRMSALMLEQSATGSHRSYNRLPDSSRSSRSYNRLPIASRRSPSRRLGRARTFHPFKSPRMDMIEETEDDVTPQAATSSGYIKPRSSQSLGKIGQEQSICSSPTLRPASPSSITSSKHRLRSPPISPQFRPKARATEATNISNSIRNSPRNHDVTHKNDIPLRSFQASGEYFDIIAQCENLSTADCTMIDDYCTYVSACDTPSASLHLRLQILFLTISWLAAFVPYFLPLFTYKFAADEADGRIRVGKLSHDRLVDISTSIASFQIDSHGAWMTIPTKHMTALFISDILDFGLIWVLTFELLQYIWASFAMFDNMRNCARVFTEYFPHYIAVKAKRNAEIWLHERRDILAIRNRSWLVLRPLLLILFMMVFHDICTIVLSCFRHRRNGSPWWFGVATYWNSRNCCIALMLFIAFVLIWIWQHDVNAELESQWIISTKMAAKAALSSEGRSYLLTARTRLSPLEHNLRLFPRKFTGQMMVWLTISFTVVRYTLYHLIAI